MAGYGQHLARVDQAERAEAMLVLTLMTTPGIGPKRLARILSAAAGLGLTIEDLLGSARDVFASQLGIPAQSAAQLPKSYARAEGLLPQLSAAGVSMLRPDRQPYPRIDHWDPLPQARTYPVQLGTTLGDDAPAILFVAGDLDLLVMPGVGFCGSREASDRGLEAVRASAGDLAASRINVISGYARGVDAEAHLAALRSSGVTTMVLAEGILNFRPRHELGDWVTESNALVISQFPPSMPWSAANAMTRNETICALADAMVVVESGMSGGTFAAGTSALKLGRPLFVVDYGEGVEIASGNRHFLALGARPLRRSRATGRPNTDELVDAALKQARTDDYRASRLTSYEDLWQEAAKVREDPTPPTLWRTMGVGVNN